MASSSICRAVCFHCLIGAGIAIGCCSAPIVLGALTPAQAQISEDAQIALEQYGVGARIRASATSGCRPGCRRIGGLYAYGRWVYTDDWGWYWVSDDVEANWGWVVYHYGRWAFERGFGWFWVPGDEWAPAWVNWRYGDDYVGWAPLPPDELVGAYEVEPAYWAFVPGRYLGRRGCAHTSCRCIGARSFCAQQTSSIAPCPCMARDWRSIREFRRPSSLA